jgi:hypothetical protein
MNEPSEQKPSTNNSPSSLTSSWLPYLLVAALLVVAAAALFGMHGWSAVVVLAVLAAALTPAAIAIRAAPEDADDWWSPVWTAPPLVFLYGLTCVVLAATYLRRLSLPDVTVVLAGILAASLIGSFLGFIFAIPRSLQPWSAP